jgi:sec-independent protein translocase protein TatA
MRFPQGAEWLIILLVILLLFGAKRLPDAARGLGRSLRILKAETKGLHDDGDGSVAPAPAREQLPPAAAPAPTTEELAARGSQSDTARADGTNPQP